MLRLLLCSLGGFDMRFLLLVFAFLYSSLSLAADGYWKTGDYVGSSVDAVCSASIYGGYSNVKEIYLNGKYCDAYVLQGGDGRRIGWWPEYVLCSKTKPENKEVVVAADEFGFPTETPANSPSENGACAMAPDTYPDGSPKPENCVSNGDGTATCSWPHSPTGDTDPCIDGCEPPEPEPEPEPEPTDPDEPDEPDNPDQPGGNGGNTGGNNGGNTGGGNDNSGGNTGGNNSGGGSSGGGSDNGGGSGSCTGDNSCNDNGGEDPKGDGGSASGMGCDQPLRCEGDAIQCAVLQQQKAARCEAKDFFDLDKNKGEINSFLDNEKFKPGDVAKGDSIQIPDFISNNTRFLPSSCPPPIAINLSGRSLSFSYEPLCYIANLLSPLIVMLATVAATMYVGRSFGGN
ncbi:hypothetical protein HW090_13175 [Pseudomonas sp. ABC1]|uniref:virulence factor TspB C-terminal domain-related protein n=1 Tax=Pseudomonas sp. ABC1 TaxID=2748080 RepID=UPI0015C2D2FD|nr:virulence factor TspB C-terminal domain-related protein [Pseudomonas sp. ABC1]QLF94095.1 hypothetical protein HW090_13175 [Pseudomonas sp. ABC1]